MSGPGFYDELWTVVDGVVDEEWEVTCPVQLETIVDSIDRWWTPIVVDDSGVASGCHELVQLFSVSHGHDPLTAEDVDEGYECVCAQMEQSHLPIREWMVTA